MADIRQEPAPGRARPRTGVRSDTLLAHMLDPRTRLGTSRSAADPSGNYAHALFDRCDAMQGITLRIDFDENRALGQGKVRLLAFLGQAGSISAAGREMGMSYRRAWLLIDALNQTFQRPVVQTRQGGVGGGGADLTVFGIALVANYRVLQREKRETLAHRIDGFEKALASSKPA